MATLRALSEKCYRGAIASRSMAAIVGGYAVAAGCSAGLALALARTGVPAVEAVVAANMVAFLVYTVVALWAFRCASALRVWRRIASLALLLAIATWLLERGQP
jgi:hypothetical protein